MKKDDFSISIKIFHIYHNFKHTDEIDKFGVTDPDSVLKTASNQGRYLE